MKLIISQLNNLHYEHSKLINFVFEQDRIFFNFLKFFKTLINIDFHVVNINQNYNLLPSKLFRNLLLRGH